MTFHYSIIIPHYNIPDLLERLLNSIPDRGDIQVIVVDDCSSEENQKKLEELKYKFTKVEFYSTGTNGGGGKARNVGLSHAIGEYIIFADADDFFTPIFNNILDDYSENDRYDIIFFNAQSVDSVSYEPQKRANNLNSFFEVANKNREKGEMIFRYIFGEPWCKIISRKILEKNSISFEELPIHNDTLFTYMIGFHAKEVKIDDRIGYCITERVGSVSKQISDENLIIRARVFAHKRQFLKSHSIDLINPIIYSPFTTAIKRKNFRLLSQALKAANKEGYSTWSLIKDYIKFRKNLNS